MFQFANSAIGQRLSFVKKLPKLGLAVVLMTIGPLSGAAGAAGLLPADPIITDDSLLWSFEDGTDGWYIRNASEAAPTLTHVSPGAAGTQGAIRAENRSGQGDGPILDVQELLSPMQRYEVSGYARFIDRTGGAGQLTLSSQTGPETWTNLLQGISVGNDWTHFSGDFTMPAFTDLANIYFETPWEGGAAGDTTAFEIDEIRFTYPEGLEWENDLIPLWATLPGIHTGVAVDSRELFGEPAQLVRHHFNKLVAENHMKPEAWWQGFGSNATFRMHPEARQILDFAQANDMYVFGHVLVWHSQTPVWFFRQDMDDAASPELTNSPADQEIMLDRMKSYIRAVAQTITDEYGLFGSPTNPVNSYEVANEVVADNPNQGLLTGGLRPNSPWTRIFNTDGTEENSQRFLREAFIYADQMFNGEFHVNGSVDNPVQGDDRVTLWINDYNTERGGVGFPNSPSTKRVQLLNLVNNLIDAGVPIDGVGHQFHAGLEWDVNGLRDALDLFAYDNGWVHKPVLQAITEIDVTIPGIGNDGATEDQLLAQGDYYRQAFDIIRQHQAQYGDIDTVTMWGLTDNRSWRADQLPLLFDVGLNAKPAFAGAVASHALLTDAAGLAARPEGGAWNIPALGAIAQSALVFGGDFNVPLTDAMFDGPEWVQLPAHPLANSAGNFHLRWTPPQVLTIYATVNGLESQGQETELYLYINGRSIIVNQQGQVITDTQSETEAINTITRVGADSWQAIVTLLFTARPGPSAEFNIARITGGAAMSAVQGEMAVLPDAWSLEGAGALSLLPEDLSYLQIPEAETRPVLDGDIDSVWADAPIIHTDKLVEGNPNGATAEVRTLWYQGEPGSDQPYVTLYVLAEVTDPVIDTTGTQDHEKDSVEVFVGLADRTGDPHQLYDAQFRVDTDGAETFGQGANDIQAQRVQSAVRMTDTGYIVEMAIAMRTDTGHMQGQWNDGLAGLGTVHNFDVQVNDATNGVRTAVHTWADPSGSGWGSTARLGVAQFVEYVDAAGAMPGQPDVTPPAETEPTETGGGPSALIPIALTGFAAATAGALLLHRRRSAKTGADV